ncbi:hypothetical protein Tco_0183638 [Tanacetum coccineum]
MYLTHTLTRITPDIGNRSYEGGKYGAPGDDYFTGTMPSYRGNSIVPSSGYAVGGSSRGVQVDDDDEEMSDQMARILELKGRNQESADLTTHTPRHYTPYPRISSKNILEDIRRGLHSKKPQYAEMGDLDITMEEYVRLETERALRNGKEYNWKQLRMVRSRMMKTFTTSDCLKQNSQL